jgi:RHS repeat-associated protein
MVSAQVASAQVATGLPPFGSFGGGPFDTVNNANLDVHFQIPVVSKAGRGLPFYYLLAYDNSIWVPVNSSGSQVWAPVVNWGWSGITDGATGYVTYNVENTKCPYGSGPPFSWYYWTIYGGFAYVDPVGTSHQFNTVSVSTWTSGAPCGSGPPANGSGVASDGSGYTLITTIGSAGPSGSLYSRSGTQIDAAFVAAGQVPPASGGWIVDPNGNTISWSVSSNTTTYTDTLGTTALTVAAPGGGSSATYTYAGPNGNGVYTVKYSSYTVETNFGCSGISDYGPSQQYLVGEIDLPDKSKYTFTYENTPSHSGKVTGRLATVTLPTGGTISYQYTGSNNGIICTDGSAATLKRYTPDTGSSNYWEYQHSETGTAWTTTLTDPQGNVTTYNFQQILGTPSAFETERQVAGLETVVTCYNNAPSPCSSSSNTTAIALPISQRTVTTTLGSEESEVNTYYNSYGLVTTNDEYDFGNGSVGAFKRETMICYASLTNAYILDRPSYALVYSATGNASNCTGTSGLVAETSYVYDGSGNLKSETRTNTNGSPSSVSRNFTYGSYGVLQKSTDFNGNPTTYTNTACNNSFPTEITLPITSLALSLAWDNNCNGAVITSVTDPNGAKTTYSYDTTDNIWRLAGTSFPDGGGTTIAYTSPAVRDVYTNVFGSTQRHDQIDLDGLGRLETTSLVSDPDGQTYVNTSYDSDGRLLTVSNPYRTSTSGGDTYSYDALNRLTKVTHADSTYGQISYGGSASQSCSASTYGYGYPTLYTDESGNQRQVFTDALGRVIEADEPTSSSNTLSVYTCYLYDVLGNLKEVDQGSETRKYTYDMLSRVTGATTPEAENNTRYFYYTTSGNALCSGDPSAVCYRNDERGVTTTYSYDNLNRLTGISYSNGDPSIYYSYDQTSYNGLTISNGKGRRTGMSDGSGQTAWSYDTMGRALEEERTIGSVTKTLGYTYNLDGSLASVTYPSGRTVNYAVSAVGRPLTAIDNADNITYVGPANSTYAPQGALATAAYGANISFSASYNNRLLLSNLEGYTSSATLFQLQPAYNPNGTVSSVTNGVNSARTQTFTYDYLNRITSASSAATSGAYCWGQSVPTNGTGYDRYGNLLIINVSQCTAPTLNLSVNAYNQITNSGFSYDAAGNMTGDGSYSYAWNGEGLLKSAGTTTYTYDGDNKRVEKSSGTYYWFSPSGSVLAETDTSGNTQNEYIYFSGARTARRDSSGNVYYYFQDQIGSSRLIANSSGTVCYDADFTPFGYEMAYTTSCSQNYKFTGMERDVETGNDHAWFRNYEQNLGRWMSPDRLGGDITNPQSLNRYAYVANNPTTLTDPPGLFLPYGDCSWTGTCMSGGGAGWGDWENWWGTWGAGNILYENEAANEAQYVEDNCIGCVQFQGNFYGQYVNKTFDSWDQYADWRTSVAALPQNQIYDGFWDLLENQGGDPSQEYKVRVYWWGLSPNVGGMGPLNPPGGGWVRDPVSVTHPGGSFIELWPPVDSPHCAANDPYLNGTGSCHNDNFNDLWLLPLHELFEYLPSLFINPNSQIPQNTSTWYCSVVGGCHQ